MVLRTSKVMTDKWKITNGVLEGETMSLISYALFLSEIENFSIKKGLRRMQLNKYSATEMGVMAIRNK